ncbi:MAG: cytochrome P450 [Pseudomonadota bacterium]
MAQAPKQPGPRTPDDPAIRARCPVALADVDLFAQGAQEHWYESYPILHEQAPVHRIPGEGHAPGTDGFILSKYEDIARVVRDPERFPPTLFLALKGLAATGKPISEIPNVNAMMVSMASLRPDNALWRSHRQELTDPWVGPGASRHEDFIRAAATRLIDDFIEQDEIDFVAQFARPLPQLVMAHILGFPESDIPQLADWGNAQVAAFVYGKGHRNELTPEQVEAQFEALNAFEAYTAEFIAARREAPQDDMISALCNVEYQALGRKLTDVEINGIVYAMMIGGLETTQYALEEQAQLLCEHPDLWPLLDGDRDKLRGFTEEAMRLRSPTQGLSTRVTSQEEEFQGVKVPKGSLLHLRWAAGNVDPDEWECPFDVNIERKALTRHLVFSQGPRVCPGAQLSRLEQRIAWECLLDRLAPLEYAPGNRFEHQPGIMLGTLKLKLKVRPRA